MRINTFKYIFFTLLIILIIIGIYIIYKDGKKQTININNNEIEINIDTQLNIGIIQYDTINPILSYNRDIQYLDKLIFNSLIDITYDFNVENSLAKEVSKLNPTTYIIKLKDDIYWHDGEKFTARDVLFTIQNLKNESIKSIYKENVENILEIQEIDDYTIKILLNKEIEFFEYLLCFPILASHSYEEGSLISKTVNPLGTGKYKISKISEREIQLEISDKNSDSKITKINIILKDQAKELYNAFTKNEVDFIITDNIKYEEYIGTMGYNVTSSANRRFNYLVLNNNNNLLSNKEIRQAIRYAIDRQRINYNVYSNKYNICNYPIDYGSYFFNSKDIFNHNASKSKSILVDNGWLYKNNVWVKNNKNLKFDLIINKAKEEDIIVAEQIKEQLENVGMIINIIKVSDSKYNNYIKHRNYDMILTENIVSNNPNLKTYFGKENLSNFNNEEIFKILEDIKNIDDKNILKEKYSRIQQIYEEEIPFISLYFDSIFVLSNTNLKGDLSYNWYNVYYNIDNWYKIQDT